MGVMEEGNPSTPLPQAYALLPSRYSSEDILFCIDVGAESFLEMKNTGPNGRPVTRLDSILKSIGLFVNAKLSINGDHRFGFVVIGKSVSWVQKVFSSKVDSAIAAIRSLPADSSSDQVDLTELFHIASQEAKRSREQGRTLRVILLYCRSSMPPKYQLPANRKLYTLDVVYLHDKPGPENCPQKVYDALVDAIEHISEHDGYIFETSQGLQRILVKNMCLLLSSPPQRCIQDDLDVPKNLAKKPPVVSPVQGDDSVMIVAPPNSDS
ncbi:BRISC and BRCA1-A complex member 1-like protein [Drosera capensis]